MPSFIGVTGANGLIGTHVYEFLKARGYSVRGIGRKCEGHVEDRHVLDLRMSLDLPNWRRSLSGCKTVIHCAAHVHRPRETPEEMSAFAEVNVGGLDRLIEASRRYGVLKIVFVSSAAVYSGGDLAMTESAATCPLTGYARSKLKGEELVRKSGLNYTIARLGTVFGNGDTANFAVLAKAMARRRFIIPGAGCARKSVVSVRKAAELLSALALRDSGPLPLVNVAAPEAPTLSEICHSLSLHCGYRYPPALPMWLMRMGAYIGDGCKFMFGQSPLTSGVLRKITCSTVMDVSLMQRSFQNVEWLNFNEELALSASYYKTMCA